MNTQQPNIKYLLMGNTSNTQIITEFQISKNAQTQIEAKQIFEKISKLSEKKIDQRNKIQGNQGNYFFTVSTPNIFYLVNTDPSYPERHVFEMIENINKDHIPLMVTDKGELNANGRQLLKLIIERFQDIKKVNNISDVESDVNEIKLEMKENIRKIVNNVDNAKELDSKASRIKDNADIFKKDAKALERTTWWQNCKLTIIIGVIVVGVVLIIVLPLVLRS